MTSTVNLAYGSSNSLNMGSGGSALASLASSQTVGWQSEIISNLSEKAPDYEVVFELPMANTAAGNDKAVYIFIIPWYWDGSAWKAGADLGTTTAPSSSGPAACTIGGGTPPAPNMQLAKSLGYVTTNMTLRHFFNVTDFFEVCPDGFSIVIVNYSGAALGSSPVILYKAVHPEID